MFYHFRTLYPSLPNSDTNFTVNSSNKFGYFANVENRPYLSVGSTLPPQQLLGAGLGQRVGQAGAHLPSQNKDVLGTVGGNAPQHNSRLGLMGVNSSSVVNVGTSNNGSIGGNVLGVTQPQHNLMFGHSLTGNMGAQQLHGPQQHTANVNPASSGPIQSLGPQNRVALSQAAITAVKKQQRQTMPPYAVNSALFGQSSQPAWFPSPQNNIGVPPSPAKPTGFDQMFPQLNPSQAPPPLHQVGQLFTNQLMPNQPFGTTQRPHFPHSDQNPFIYQMMSQISDQHSFPNFSASGISQPTPLHSQNSGSVSLSSVPSQSQISGNLVHVHQIPSNFVHQSITSLDGVSSNFQEKQQHLSPVAHPYDELKSQHIGGTSRVLRNEHQSMNSNSAVPQPPSENMGLVYPNTDNSTKPHHSVADGCGSSNDNMPSTYSLFNSPWSSGLNLSNSASRDGETKNKNFKRK